MQFTELFLLVLLLLASLYLLAFLRLVCYRQALRISQSVLRLQALLEVPRRLFQHRECLRLLRPLQDPFRRLAEHRVSVPAPSLYLRLDSKLPVFLPSLLFRIQL